MNKEKKIGTGVAVLIILIFGAFFLIFQTSPKENSSPPNPAGKASLVAILEINGEKYESEITAGENIYDFMDKLQREGKIHFKEKNYTGMGKFIEEINAVGSSGGKYWIYYVNGIQATVGVSNYKLKSGDVVSLKYEKNY